MLRSCANSIEMDESFVFAGFVLGETEGNAVVTEVPNTLDSETEDGFSAPKAQPCNLMP